jgi:hypothetical protein
LAEQQTAEACGAYFPLRQSDSVPATRPISARFHQRDIVMRWLVCEKRY